MVVITHTFSGILDDWLASKGHVRAHHLPARTGASAALSLEQWSREVREAVAVAPGPARGLEIGQHVRLSHAGPLGYMVVNTKTLGELLSTYLLLEKWFYGRNWAQLITEGEHTAITWHGRMGVADRVIEQLHAMALVVLVRAACPTVKLRQVAVMSGPKGEASAYRAAFACPVHFDQPALRIEFAAHAMQAPVDMTHAALNLAWCTRQRTLREALPTATEFVRAVQEAILHTLPMGAPADAVAKRLNLSRRTLQRRLTESSCTYRQLLDGIRERHARHLLIDPALSRREIAFLLGYAAQSAFNHTCQRWNRSSLHSAQS